MSRAVRWQMQFMSKTATQYTVSIYDEGWSGAVTTLLPADEPFMTQEETDDNAFQPIRYSTGYLRFIVEDLSVIDNIMTTAADGRYITLTKIVSGSSVLVWQGYMQAQSFDGEWEAAPHEVEFPIVSSLGVLDEMSYTPIRQYMTLGYLLKLAITNNYTDFDTWHTPVRGETHDLLATINDDVFRREENDEWAVHLGYNADIAFPGDKMTCLDVIREICKFFGWSLREQGSDLYFVSVKGTTNYQYGTIAGITQSTLTISGSETINTVIITGVQSTENDREFLRGYGYFEINEDVDSPSNLVNFNLAEAEPADTQLHINDSVYYVRYNNISDGNIIATAENTGDFLTAFGSRQYYGCILARVKIIEDRNIRLAYYSSLDEYKPGVLIKKGPDEKVATFTSTRPFVGRNYIGGLLMDCSIEYWTGAEWGDVPENTQFKMQIKWGNKYLVRNSVGYMDYLWTTTPSTISILIYNGSLRDTYKRQVGFGPTFSVEGVHIPVTNDLTGTLTVTLYAESTGDSSISDTMMFCSNITLAALRPNEMSISSFIDYNINRFRVATAMGGSEVFTQSNLLCSAIDQSQECDELVLTNDMTAALDTKPEIDTVTRMAAMYGQPKEQLWLDVARTNLLPYDIVSVNSQNYYCASVENRWRDSQMRIQLQKL